MIRSNLSHAIAAAALTASVALAAQTSAPAKYDPAAETTVVGVIQQVPSAYGADNRVGVHLIVKTSSGLVRVHVAPAAFIGQQNFSFLIDENVEIVGARATVDHQPVVLARTVIKDGKTLVVRDEKGAPKWEGGEGDGCGVSHPPMF